MSTSEGTNKPEQINLANLSLEQLVQIKQEFEQVSFIVVGEWMQASPLEINFDIMYEIENNDWIDLYF